MKRVLLLAVLGVALCAFAATNSKNTETIVENQEVVLAEPPPLDEFANQEEWEEYRAAYANENAAAENNASFDELLKQFPKGQLPYTLTADALREQFDAMRSLNYNESQKIKKNVLPSEFRKFFPSLNNSSKFSRMPPPIGEPFRSFEAQGKHVLVYFTRRGSYQYRVATFTQKGKLISERYFAHAGFDDINDATLDENLNLTCNSYEVVWDKEPDANGYKNCKITGLKLVKKTVESLLKEDSQKEMPLKKEVVQRANP